MGQRFDILGKIFIKFLTPGLMYQKYQKNPHLGWHNCDQMSPGVTLGKDRNLEVLLVELTCCHGNCYDVRTSLKV